jgi:hypothetical protein
MTQYFKPVSNMADLAQFGIKALTGEACAFSLRVLCDVNESGLELLQDYFGAPGLELADNWNSTVNEEPAIGSIMLPRGITKDMATFALFRAGAVAVVYTANDSATGVFDQARLEEYEKASASGRNSLTGFTILRNPRISSQAPMAGSRNIHAATGRAH